MSETVEIKVKQTMEGDAVRRAADDLEKLNQAGGSALGKSWSKEVAQQYPETVKKIQDNLKLAATYESKNMPEAAASVRKDTMPFVNDLARATKERLADEKAVTKEHRDRDTILKAQESARERRNAALGRLGRSGATFLETAMGESRFGGITSALSGFGPGGATAATATAIALAVLAAQAQRDHAMTMINMSAASARAADARAAGRMGGYAGSSGAAQAAIVEAREEAQQREDDKARLEKDAKPKWYKPMEFGAWINNLFGGGMQSYEGEEAIAKNNAAQSNAVKKEHDMKADRDKLWKEEGELSLQASQQRLSFDMRAARETERTIAWRKRYKQILSESGDQNWEEAMKGAQLAYDVDVRAEQMKWGRLVNARSGAGDIARAAGLAMGEFSGHHSTAAAVHKQTAIMTAHHEQARADRSIHALKVPSLKRPSQQNAEILAKYGT